MIDDINMKNITNKLYILINDQNDQINGFRNHLANINLFTKFIYITYYSIGFIYFSIIVTLLLCYQYTIKTIKSVEEL